jgi:Flp pilus assembly pilin Flp
MPSQEYLEALRCRRSQWIDHDLFGQPLLDVVTKRRRCKEFLSYKPGFSPEEHMKRLTDSDQRKAQLWYTFLAAFIAAVLVLVGQTGQQWLARVLGLSTPPSATTTAGPTAKKN